MVKSPFKKATLFIFLVLAVVALDLSHSKAQGMDFGFGSLLPLKSIESVLGPLLPANGIGETFRSEFGIGLSTPIFDKIRLDGGGVSYDLLINQPSEDGGTHEDKINRPRSIDGGPVVYDFFAKFRAWRFAAKADYQIFEARSRRADRGGFFFNSVVLSGDSDIIQGPWFAAGVRAKFFLSNPYFKFNRLTDKVNVDFEASAPWTIGPYIRYVPPEILGFPVHFEAWIDFPLKGSPYTSYAAALVFRPQIYRFDLFTRLKFERTTFIVSGTDSATNTSWDLNLLWNLYGAEFGIYF
ncbi:MAG: hypothetical protein V1897_05390 [Pseudomonadota bacterium]